MDNFVHTQRVKAIVKAQEDKHAKLQSWIDAVNQTGKGLTDWEEHFMESITEQFAGYGVMSPKQEEQLERIYAERTPN